MFLAEPQPTKFDVQFSIGKIPVRVHPLFGVISLAFGAYAVRGAGASMNKSVRQSAASKPAEYAAALQQKYREDDNKYPKNKHNERKKI